MTIKSEIIYPIFLLCCKFTPNIFWETIFEDLAYGKTPYGTYISNNFFCCSYKNKEFSYKIEDKDPEKLYTDIYNLLTNNLGLLSNQEKSEKIANFNNIENNIKESRKSWNSIRKKNVKDILIEQYVISVQKKFSLTLHQTKYLLSLIFIAIIFKAITAKDIIYENNKIVKIDGIDFEKEKIILKRDIYTIETSFNAQIIMSERNLSDSWDKYLKDLRKFNIF